MGVKSFESFKWAFAHTKNIKKNFFFIGRRKRRRKSQESGKWARTKFFNRETVFEWCFPSFHCVRPRFYGEIFSQYFNTERNFIKERVLSKNFSSQWNNFFLLYFGGGFRNTQQKAVEKFKFAFSSISKRNLFVFKCNLVMCFLLLGWVEA